MRSICIGLLINCNFDQCVYFEIFLNKEDHTVSVDVVVDVVDVVDVDDVDDVDVVVVVGDSF